ncbi:Down syndrome cell adhesion molecule-like protein Dscam2 [Centruroides sculpturatus]|uniref:Down syndrome cell adhesion molecule-like protein Dscam2 n=1 Tax=Centruroides sculpturatus TaxID=218467 RepID=UPI000C6D452F|nr:Down syndrome cell adhesion molecule-like protein Dscam2 [Centruroides sculpturatus]
MIPYASHYFLIAYISVVSSSGIEIVPPKIQTFNFPTDLRVGQSAKAICSVKEGLGPYDFRWTKDNLEITSTSEITYQVFDDYSILVIEKLAPAQIGNYTCRVTSSSGSDQFTASLMINAPPSWKFEPRDLTISEGKSFNISCEAVGYPKPLVQWKTGIYG